MDANSNKAWARKSVLLIGIKNSAPDR